jgi:putative ABC transport system permease protein
VEAAPLKVPGAMDSVTHYYLFLPDFSDYVEPLLSLRNETLGISLVHLIWYLTFDMDYSHYTPDPELVVQSGSDENIDWTTSREVQYTLMSVLADFCYSQSDICSGYSIFDYESERADYLALYGSLFFLGIALSLVFLFAAVLIIYYKQLSEGYEDQSRFEIMQKVGMTKQEIRRSINAQVLTVFFAPLLLAGVHLAFAFSLIWNLLRLLDVNNLTLLIWVNVICFLALGVLYGVVYYLTSRTYYRIVSGAKAD